MPIRRDEKQAAFVFVGGVEGHADSARTGSEAVAKAPQLCGSSWSLDEVRIRDTALTSQARSRYQARPHEQPIHPCEPALTGKELDMSVAPNFSEALRRQREEFADRYADNIALQMAAAAFDAEFGCAEQEEADRD